MKIKIATIIFSIFMLASVAVAQQTRICPYTGQPYVVGSAPPSPYTGQTVQYNPPIQQVPVTVDQQRMLQQQIQRAQLQAQQTMQLEQLRVQHRLQTLQMEFGHKSPPSQIDQQMFQQQVQAVQQELQQVQQRFNDEMRRIQSMR